MFNTIFGQLGQGFNQGHMAQQNAAQATQYGMAHNAAQQSAMAQQAAQQGLGMSAGSYPGIKEPMRWMFDGVLVEFRDFVNLVFPEDTPEKTVFILRYSNNNNE